MSRKSIFCIASSRHHAEKIVYRLKNSGFSSKDVSTLFPDERSTEERTAASEAAKTVPGGFKTEDDSLTWIAGFGPLAISDLGPFLAAGPIVRALQRAEALPKRNRITGSLIEMGIPEQEAKCFEGKIKHGNVLLSVHNEHPGEISRASAIIQQHGGQDLCSTDDSAGC
jgi:hypothetical protein